MQQQSLRDLAYYRADLARIARLSREEEVELVGRLRLARMDTFPAPLATAAKHRLVEGNQYLVVFLALRVHTHFRRQGLEDLIQEASLSLVEATEQCPYTTETFSGYASLAIRRGLLGPAAMTCRSPSPSISSTGSTSAESCGSLSRSMRLASITQSRNRERRPWPRLWLPRL